MRLRPDACTTISAASGEPLHAHAPPRALGLVLLEHPGPWGPEAAARNPLVPAGLREAADERGLRVQLIRRLRPERQPATGHACYLGFSGARGGWLEHRRLDHLDDVLHADLDALAAGRQPGFGERVDEPLFLVCTHGKVDACCAQFGRPVARAVAEAVGDDMWETTHVGGCRFAANLVCLPHGVYYGRLTPESARRAVTSLRRGQLELDVYRGRMGAPQAVQAAEYEVRRQEALTGLDDLRLEGHRCLEGGVEEVALAAAAHRYDIRLRLEPQAERRYGCGADGSWAPEAYRVTSLHRRPLRSAALNPPASLAHPHRPYG